MILNRTLLTKHPGVLDHLIDVLLRPAKVTAHRFVDHVLTESPAEPNRVTDTLLPIVDPDRSPVDRLRFDPKAVPIICE